MLTTGESKIVFAYILFGQIFCLLPFQLDYRTGKFQKVSKFRNCCWYFLFYVTLANTIYSDLYFIYARLFLPPLPAPVVATQLTFAFNPSVYMSVMIWAELKERGLMFQTFNEVYTSENVSKKTRKWSKYSALEFLASYFALLGVFQVVVIILMLNSSPILTAVSQTFVTPGSSELVRLAVLTFDSIVITNWLHNYIFLLMIHALVVSKISDWVAYAEEVVSDRRKPPTDRIELIYRKCRQTHLLSVMFNRLNKYTLFSFKMMMMILAIQNGYVIIRHYKSNIFMVLFSGILAISIGVVDYKLMFDATYKVQERVGGVHQKMNTLIRSIKDSEEGKLKRLLLRQVRSLPPMGIQVGGFYNVQRDATVQFMEFVSTQLVGLLVTF